MPDSPKQWSGSPAATRSALRSTSQTGVRTDPAIRAATRWRLSSSREGRSGMLALRSVEGRPPMVANAGRTARVSDGQTVQREQVAPGHLDGAAELGLDPGAVLAAQGDHLVGHVRADQGPELVGGLVQVGLGELGGQ